MGLVHGDGSHAPNLCLKNSACHAPNHVKEIDKMREVTGTYSICELLFNQFQKRTNRQNAFIKVLQVKMLIWSMKIFIRQSEAH